MADKRDGKFKDRYVLGEGYPWAWGLKPYQTIGINKEKNGLNAKNIKFPKKLWEYEVPKYRLVLERVKQKAKRSRK